MNTLPHSPKYNCIGCEYASTLMYHTHQVQKLVYKKDNLDKMGGSCEFSKKLISVTDIAIYNSTGFLI